MRRTTHSRRAFLLWSWLGLGLSAAPACGHDEPPTKPGSNSSAGGESALDRAEHDANRAHEGFKRDVKQAADVVDEKANAIVDEGKKAVNKVVDAVDGSDSSSTQKPREKPPEHKSGEN